MSDLERFNELVDEIYEMVLGTKRNPKPKRARTKVDIKQMINLHLM